MPVTCNRSIAELLENRPTDEMARWAGEERVGYFGKRAVDACAQRILGKREARTRQGGIDLGH